MLGDREAALDVVQETFAIALARRDGFRGEATALTWVTSIARNLCLARVRPGRERTFEDFEAVIEQFGRASRSAQSEAERRRYAEEVKQGCLIGLLACLPVAQRIVFVLHLLNDLSIAEVAAVMDRSENAVRILLSRARARMRRFLCANCLLLGGSTCTCANMIDFSLARGLIEPIAADAEPDRVANELRQFGDEIELYRSLPDRSPRIADALASSRFTIFGPR